MLKRDEVAALERGEGCLGKSADDEPVFILCARDTLAPDTVRTWADAAEAAMCNPEKVASARALADQMEAWQGNRKLPD